MYDEHYNVLFPNKPAPCCKPGTPRPHYILYLNQGINILYLFPSNPQLPAGRDLHTEARAK